jgi:pSer/pThr/pTyr-binding forkhead associated (FHA) protein
MSARVTLTVLGGKLKGQEFVFTGRTLCSIGRSSGCYVQLPNDKEHDTVSRQHCLLDIEPPAVRIRDLGSLNGTYVNGQKIGQRDQDQAGDSPALRNGPEYSLKAGDEIRLGNTAFLVSVLAPEVGRIANPSYKPTRSR